jgi:hypothetical protein
MRHRTWTALLPRGMLIRLSPILLRCLRTIEARAHGTRAYHRASPSGYLETGGSWGVDGDSEVVGRLALARPNSTVNVYAP